VTVLLINVVLSVILSFFHEDPYKGVKGSGYNLESFIAVGEERIPTVVFGFPNSILKENIY
jgi:hypothetical protein